MKVGFEKYRILLSRVAVGVGFVVLVFSKGYWNGHNGLFEFLLFSSGLVLLAIASLGRMWCSLYIAGYKNDKLVQEGPYSICRNPLYFFSFLGVLGLGLATETITFPILFVVLFALYYPFVIKREEGRLESLFPDEFKEYKKKVPSFLPNFSNFKEPEEYVVKPSVYRGHMISALWFIWLAGIIELLEGLRNIGVIPTFFVLY